MDGYFKFVHVNISDAVKEEEDAYFVTPSEAFNVPDTSLLLLEYGDSEIVYIHVFIAA